MSQEFKGLSGVSSDVVTVASAKVQQYVLDVKNYIVCKPKQYPMLASVISNGKIVKVTNRFIRLNYNLDTYTMVCPETPILIRGEHEKYEHLAISSDYFCKNFFLRYDSLATVVVN